MSVNKVILVGNVGKDPEVHFIEQGVAVARFPFATSETYKSKDGERVTTTEWHNIVLWRGLAEVADKYVRKGSQLYLEGRIKTRSYDDKDGNKRYITEIVGDNMQMLGKKGDVSTADSPGETRQNSNVDTGAGSRDSQGKGTTDTSNPFDSDDMGINTGDGADDLPF
ncbi:MAG: single-stranded DNA-binding protein [Bacteroidia bacterium]|nr:MAG: single-stranded DNA-binding protein [Bacteroidia bacterium]